MMAGAIRSLVNARDLQSVIVLHETLFVLVLTYGSETMIWKKKRSRITAVQRTTLEACLVLGGWRKSRMHG